MPPTQRTRRNGLVHGRSVPLPAALGGDGYIFDEGVVGCGNRQKADMLRLQVRA